MNILITAGPTWVKIDEVRIITNIFTGGTGVFLAREFQKKKHNVTLLLNPHRGHAVPKGVRALPFRYFNELKALLEKELKEHAYEVIIHSAAVSDYTLKKPFTGKIPSNKEELFLKLARTPKLIKRIRSLAKGAFLIQFKLEIAREGLLEKAIASLKDNKSNIVVANAYEDLRRGYTAFIIDKNRRIRQVSSKKDLFANLHKLCKKQIIFE